MSHYPLVMFVDSPSVGAVVRLDLNDGSAAAPRRVEADVDLGTPTLEGDPKAIGQVFGSRSSRFTVQVNGTKSNALAFLSALSRELLRRTNWVMFQLSATTPPIWFKTYRAGYQPLSLEYVYGDTETGGSASLPDTWRVDVPLVADPFAYGARVAIPAATVGNNPASGNFLRVTLPTIKGDAPTPLRVKVTPLPATSGSAGHAGRFIHGVVSGDSVTPRWVNVGGADGWTVVAGSGVAASSSSASYIGGNGRLANMSVGTGGLAGDVLVTRMTTTLADVTPGRYRIFLATAFGDVDEYQFALGQTVAGQVRFGPTATETTWETAISGHGFQGWVDLGVFTFPFGTDIPVDLRATMGASDVALSLAFSESTATDTALIDGLLLVPIDDTASRQVAMFVTSQFESPTPGGPTGQFDHNTACLWDGDDETTLMLAATGDVAVGAPTLIGGFPTVDPGAATNVLYAFPTARGARSTGDELTWPASTWTVEAWYYPRYLHIGDGT